MPVILFGLCATASADLVADTFRVVPSIGLSETWTNNVGLAPSGSKQADFITQISPGVALSETGPRTSLAGFISVPVVLYARTGAENNQAYVQANVTGSVEAIERFFFIDAAASVSQQYITPFGAQPPGLVNATANRYTAQTYALTPSIKGVMPGGVTYELRDYNLWSVASGASVALSNAYTNDLIGRLTRNPTPTGWTVEYERTSVDFTTQPPLLTQLGRVRLIHQPDPEVQVSLSGGYENNDYTFTSYRGPIYGVGGIWHPTDRTNVEGWWEHRFFGASYLFNFMHRMSQSVWIANASRNITTYPQQLAALPAGFNTSFLLNELFLSSIPDPAQRQAAVNQFISNRGLPTVLSDPVNLYTEQIQLQELASASLGLLGARNSIFFSIFYSKTQPITAAGNTLPGLLGVLSNSTQEGVGAGWTHTLSPQMTFALNGVATRAVSNSQQEAVAAGIGTTKQAYVTATLTSPLGPNTTVNAGISYQVQSVDLGTGYNAFSIFAGLLHTFR